MHLRKDDVVEVIAGDDKGTRGKVLRVLREQNKIVVEGINKVYRHLKPSRRNPQGGRLSSKSLVLGQWSLVIRRKPVSSNDQGLLTKDATRPVPNPLVMGSP